MTTDTSQPWAEVDLVGPVDVTVQGREKPCVLSVVLYTKNDFCETINQGQKSRLTWFGIAEFLTLPFLLLFLHFFRHTSLSSAGKQ